MSLLRLLVRHRHQRRGRQIRSPVSRPPRSRTVQLSGSPGGRRADRRSSLWMRRLVLFDPRILHPLLGQTCTTIYSMCSVLRASPRSLLRAALAPMRRASTTPARPAAHGTTTAAPTAAPTACGYDERASGYCSEGTDARALATSPDGAVSTCRHRRPEHLDRGGTRVTWCLRDGRSAGLAKVRGVLGGGRSPAMHRVRSVRFGRPHSLCVAASPTLSGAHGAPTGHSWHDGPMSYVHTNGATTANDDALDANDSATDESTTGG